MKKSTFSILFLAGIFLFFGCNNLADKIVQGANDSETPSTAVVPNDGKAYITFASPRADSSARTALPDFTEDGIADFTYTLTGAKTAAETQEELGVYSGLSELSSASVACSEGTWNFTLRAEKDGTVLTGSITNKEITAGENELAFVLTWDRTSLSGTGSLSFTLDYSEASNAASVALATAELFSYDVATSQETALDDYPETELTRANNSVTFEAFSLAAGNYRIKIHLYADSEKKSPINTWTELAIITGGQTSTGRGEMDSLNKVYSITYDTDGGEFANTQTVAGNFTRITETFALPLLTKTGCTFDGWYTNADFTGAAVTQIAKGSTGNRTFFAKFTPETYTVSFVTDKKYANGTTESQTFTYGEEQALSNSYFEPVDGYEFKEWNTADDGSGTSYNQKELYTFTENTVLYAIWDPITYSITYELNASGDDILPTNENPATFTVEDLPLTLASPTRSGYVFGGWFTDIEFSGNATTQITAVPVPTNVPEITLYAKWIKVSVSVQTVPETDLILTSEVAGSTVVFTATNGGDSYLWSVDGENQSGETDSTFTLDLSDLAEGTYVISVVSGALSAAATVSVGESTGTVPEGFVRVMGTTITGDENWTPESSVFISGRSLTIHDLYVCDHEVTQKEYSAYMITYGEAVSDDNFKWTDTYGKGDNYPAYRVNWYEAVIYCNLRSMAEGLTPAYYLTVGGAKKTDPADWIGVTGSNIAKDENGKYYYNATDESSVLDYKGETDTDGGIQCDFTADGYRLPTEAEWEYIARGANTSSTTYSGSNTIDDVAWYYYNSYNKGINDPDYGTHEVKTKAKNSLGIYDMSGNVYEWCWDWYESISSYTGAAGSSSGSSRVHRGGSWYDYAFSICKVASRDGSFPYSRGSYYGFRLVRNAN